MQNTSTSQRVLACAIMLGLAATPCLTLAADNPVADLGDLLTASGITANGHLEASYTTGFNKGQTLAYRTFDTRSDTFQFNQAYLNIGFLPTSGFGALATVLAGDDAKAVNGSYGDGTGNFSLGQAYVQYVNGALTVIGGRFWTLAGVEVVDSTADGNVSRSLLFQLAQPFAHTGIRAAYKVGDFTAYLGLDNSGSGGRATDDNKQKTVEVGGTYAPSAALTLSLFDYYGFEGAGPALRTNYLDGVAVIALAEPLTLSLNADWYRVSGSGADIYAAGIGAWLGYQIAPEWKATVRGEYLSTKNVLACPKATAKCDIEEATGTLDYQAYKSKSGLSSFDVLAEVRVDFSGQRVFPNPDLLAPGSAKNQGNFAVKAIYKF